MVKRLHNELVFTVKNRCKVCYTCVRECPVKAIKIINGQAEVISSRCIGCGNCTQVCSQNAKKFLDTTDEVLALLTSDSIKVACVAPSFAVEFTDLQDHTHLVGMIKKLGFDYVLEVAFGADLIANEYNKLFDDKNRQATISADCPAITYYVKHYAPELVPSLAPIVSPMVATVRVAKKMFGNDIKTVFIGPCVAKKAESTEVDVALTFKELRKLFRTQSINMHNSIPIDFDEPHGSKAALFPVTRGKLHAINKMDDMGEENILVASGRVNFKEAIKEFEFELNKSQHLELLCCDGCIMGPGMSKAGHYFYKVSKMKDYLFGKVQNLDTEKWQKYVNHFKDEDYSQSFVAADRRIPLPSNERIEAILVSTGKANPKDHLNCGACGYDTCVEHAIAIVEGLAETEMCLPFTIEKLHKSIDELNLSNEKLASAQQSLKQSEKLAAMGQFSAGIAHELNNPLGIITMYSNILLEETPEDNPLRNDLQLIAEQADRCKKIVGGLLNFARKNQARLEEVNVDKLIQRSFKSLVIPESVEIVYENNLTDPFADMDKDQWMQVLTNVEKNAIEAMPNEKGTLTVILEGTDDEIEFLIKDDGMGIPEDNSDKIFTPFFTSKQVGKGTGLGLPLVYGIVKMHKGQIAIESNSNPEKGPTGTTFKIKIPRRKL